MLKKPHSVISFFFGISLDIEWSDLQKKKIGIPKLTSIGQQSPIFFQSQGHKHKLSLSHTQTQNIEYIFCLRIAVIGSIIYQCADLVVGNPSNLHHFSKIDHSEPPPARCNIISSKIPIGDSLLVHKKYTGSRHRLERRSSLSRAWSAVVTWLFVSSIPGHTTMEPPCKRYCR